jgi:predicted RNA-binding Zn-ribbon protein involved in translation (DUF1610 family)
MLRNRSFTDEQFIEAVKTSTSIAQVLRKLSLSAFGSHYRATKILIEKLKLDTNHFTGQGYLKGRTHNWGKKLPLEDILVKQSMHSNISNIKRRLIKEGIKEYKCVECGISNEWNGKQLKLQLDHINGDNRDHRKENLRFLCPNCHSQTLNFCGKNRKYNKKEKLLSLKKEEIIITKEEEEEKSIEKPILKVSTRRKHFCICGTQISIKAIRCYTCNFAYKQKITWPTKEKLESLIWEKPMTTLSLELGVTDVAIKKRCKKLDIKVPEIGYWLRNSILNK